MAQGAWHVAYGTAVGDGEVGSAEPEIRFQHFVGTVLRRMEITVGPRYAPSLALGR